MGCALEYLRSKKSRWAVLVALAGLWLQILLPVGQAVASSLSEDGFPDRIFICSPYGPKLFDLTSGEIVPVNESGSGSCPICLAYAIGFSALNNAEAAEFQAPSLVVQAQIDAAYSCLGGQDCQRPYLSRAPPFSV